MLDNIIRAFELQPGMVVIDYIERDSRRLSFCFSRRLKTNQICIGLLTDTRSIEENCYNPYKRFICVCGI